MLVTTAHVCKYFRAGASTQVRAVDDISLKIPRNSFVVLTGPSGSGKSTLLALLGALHRPTGGEVTFASRNFSRCSDAELARLRRRIGFVFQDFGLLQRLSVLENITYALIPHGLSAPARQARSVELLRRFGLSDKCDTRAAELSGGEQQRVALARAVAGKPELILADEPTSNLDPESGAVVFDLLQQLHAEGTTVIVSSHDPRAIDLATAVVQLKAGKLLEAEGAN